MMNQLRKEMIIYFIVAFGLPVVLGVFMGIAYANGIDTSGFPLVWMYLPASGVMLAKLLAEKENKSVPKVFYVTFVAFALLMAILCVVGTVLPRFNVVLYISMLAMLSCPVCFVEMLCMGKEKREENGLLFTRGLGRGIIGILLFVVLYLAVTFLGAAVEKLLLENVAEYRLRSDAIIWIAVMPLNLVSSFTAFFGEEYGWRYFLQPVMQKKFGLRKGVILLGLLWGIWHLPINLFYYSPQTALQSVLMQLVYCVGMGVFMGWVYMRTQNIWAVTIIHFINNNIGAALFDATAAGVVWEWRTMVISICIELAVYLPFLLAKEYREDKEDERQEA